MRNTPIQAIGDYEPLYTGEDGFVQYVLVEGEETDSSITVTVYEIVSWEEDKSPCSVEYVLKGMLKWDGCCHIDFGDDTGYMHLCGVHNWKNFTAMLKALYQHAQEHIEHFREDERWEEAG